jgi:hypothetical protein
VFRIAQLAAHSSTQRLTFRLYFPFFRSRRAFFSANKHLSILDRPKNKIKKKQTETVSEFTIDGVSVERLVGSAQQFEMLFTCSRLIFDLFSPSLLSPRLLVFQSSFFRSTLKHMAAAHSFAIYGAIQNYKITY